MNAVDHVEPMVRRLARRGYHLALGLRARLSELSSGGGASPRLYYAGARAGSYGGPRLKVSKLGDAFPEHPWTYNLVYVLSAGPYPSPAVLRRLRARAIPVVANQNGVYYPGWYAGDWEAENRRMAEPYLLADHVFYQSEFCRRSAERFLGSRQGPGEVLYNAVDTQLFRPQHRPRDDKAPFVFLVAGKVPAHQAYRLEAVVRGLAKARQNGLDARLIIAGVIDDSARAVARATAEAMDVGAQVTYSGPYAQAAAPALFGGADAFVLTTHNDACPSAVIEAMACGLPVVYARSGGVPELVGEEAGIGVETGDAWDGPLSPDPSQLGAAMIEVAGKRAAFAEAARSRAVERFDIGAWYERHRQVFQALLEARRG